MGIAITQRADLIAQTESTRAHTFASIGAWGQSGVVTGKEWFTAADERRCNFCASMDGKILGLKENYFDKGDIMVVDGENKKGEAKKFTQHLDYDDVPGPGLHSRCRCVLLPIAIDQNDL